MGRIKRLGSGCFLGDGKVWSSLGGGGVIGCGDFREGCMLCDCGGASENATARFRTSRLYQNINR